MKTLSELFEEWSEQWVKDCQDEICPLVEAVIREQLDLDEEFEIVWEHQSLGETVK